MGKGIDISVLYSLRNDFTIIALTGRTGSGCSAVAAQISKGFVDLNYPNPSKFDLTNNTYRKYEIIHKFAKQNFKNYELINYRDVLTLFFLKYEFSELISFLKSSQMATYFDESKLTISCDFSEEIVKLDSIKKEFNKFKKIFDKINPENIKIPENANSFYTHFFSTKYKNFSSQFHDILKSDKYAKHNLLLQLITNNIRRSGKPYHSNETNASNIFTICKEINTIIKAIRIVKDGKAAKVVIDSLRNPFEVMFFKQRYSAFYLMAVNREEKIRDRKLRENYASEFEVIQELLEQEYKGGKGKEFHKQYLRSCIEKADIHITFREEEEVKILNKKRIENEENTSPFYTWQMQLLKYIALIEKPGIVTPSPEERCMQLAYTAKYNSGCISRQVGAAITDKHYSIKAIGWNNTPEGQVPCLLRNAEAIINSSDDFLKKDSEKKENDQNIDLKVFTPYEKNNLKFRDAFKTHYNKEQIEENKDNLKGRNVCFCFKSLQNSISEGKNQVHTRSLHAEESAFLQITKYGGTGIMEGKLFTTASPCELCAKKAYQLNIKVIYYVDPYPGISLEQILDTGTKKPEVRLFNGAIGNAYHWLYEPFMAYKDELALILDQNIEDLTSQQKSTINTQNKRITQLEEENKRLTEINK